MTPIESYIKEFDKEFGIFITNNHYHSNRIKAFIESYLTRQREEFRKMVRKMELKGQNGESLPYENSPEIYGNQRQQSYKKGFNTALDEILKEIT